ncbi:bifunctional adenosylcobinamide kinase/adenosylcobinamide-phosphate guanylyltransferase [Devosia riboflavina]
MTRNKTNRRVTSQWKTRVTSRRKSTDGQNDVILVDCITLWITNLLIASEDVSRAVGELCATLVEFRDAKVILVTHEVGLGIVPENAMARTFRDLAGSAHQRLAEVCDDVYFVAAGLPFTLKGEPPMADA